MKKNALWTIMKPIKGKITLAMALSSFGSMLLVLGTLLMAYDLAIIGGGSYEIFGKKIEFWDLFIILAILFIAGFLISKYSFVISHLGAFDLEKILRDNLTSHLAKIELGHIVNLGAGAFKKVILEDVSSLHAFVADTTPFASKAITTPIISFILMLIIDYRLALLALFIFVIGGVILSVVMKDSGKYKDIYQSSQTNINKAVIEFVQAMPIVRTFDDGKNSFERYTSALKEYKDNLKAWILDTSISARTTMTVLSPLITILFLSVYGIYLMHHSNLSFGSFIAILIIGTSMADSLTPLMWLNNFINKSKVGAERIEEIMSLPQIEESLKPKIPLNNTIIFDNVSFGYNDDKKALKNINLHIEQNTTMALVGYSGSGKSTLLRLILRFWDSYSGNISIGGVSIKDISADELVKRVSFVSQDIFLFNQSIKDNILIARLDATDEEVINAAKLACIYDFIASLKDGFDTMVGDRGMALSGGQRQRVSIARAILRNSPIILLDEATSFSDPQNESLITNAISNLTQNKTVVSIAHRLSSVQGADKIVVFKDGQIVESGTQSELLNNKNLYEKLWTQYETAKKWSL